MATPPEPPVAAPPVPPAPPAAPPAPAPPAPAAPVDDATDWKAHSRDWEKKAKANAKAADELAALKASQMSEQEKAVADAEAKGRTAAATEYGTQLAAAKFEAAAATAGLNLGDAADLIDQSKFIGADGTVDTAAIDAAVKKLAKLSPPRAGRSGADLGGGSGEGPTDLAKQIEDATKRRDFPTVIRLKRQLAAGATT